MIKFKINNFITLKLENGKTNIYVGNELFRQCKFLLLEIPVKEISSFDELESIDDASERLDKTLEKRKLEIPAETEFWGHCSNIQVWSEYEYDTRLLHRNLAFPLLKKLSDSGDSIAKRVFKEEVVKRLEKGNQNIIDFLIEGGYTRYLDDEELIFSILDPKEFKKLKELEQNYGVKLEITQKRGGNGIKLRNRHLVYLS